jgi:hypothetical protein
LPRRGRIVREELVKTGCEGPCATAVAGQSAARSSSAATLRLERNPRVDLREAATLPSCTMTVRGAARPSRPPKEASSPSSA